MPSLRSWLAALCCCYPMYMAALFVANMLPALAVAALPECELQAVRLRPLTLIVRSGHADGTPAGPALLASTIVVITLAAGALLRVPGRGTWLAGLALSFLGLAIMQLPVQAVFVARRFNTTSIAQLLMGFGLVLAGVWKLASEEPKRLLHRLLLLLLSFPLPLAFFEIAYGPRGGFRGRAGLWHVLLTVAACLLVSLICSRRTATSESSFPRWRAAWIGAAATVVLVLAVPRAGDAVSRRLSEHRLAGGRAAVAAIPPVPADAPYPKHFFHRGVNFTAEFPASYGTKASLEMLAQLPAFGVNSVALVPYGTTSGEPPRVRLSTGSGSWESDEGIEILARKAHHLSLRIMLKPHLWSRGASRSRIDLSDPAVRKQWFADYQVFLEHYAQLATRIHADLFCIGVELESATGYELHWRRLVARTREIYPGPLVYAANFGAEFENITWWDALDYIGLDNYYPLPADFSTAEVEERIVSVHSRHNRPVLFTEAGFASRRGTNVTPWKDSTGELSTEAQARGYEAVFSAFYSKPWFAGAYWWKVGTNGYGGPTDGSHTPWRKPAMEVVGRWYISGGR